MKRLLLLLVLSAPLLGIEAPPASLQHSPECPHPWFTGPLLTPSPRVVPRGYVNFEPYFFYNVNTGVYDANWKGRSLPHFTQVAHQPLFYLGLTPNLEIEVSPQVSWQETQGQSAIVFQDLTARLGYSLLMESRENSLPSLKLIFQQGFPTGKYQKRDPRKLGTDISGRGSFQTTIGFIIGRIFELHNCHFLSLRSSNTITFPTTVHVEGFNAYGGAPNTDACIRPGKRILSLFGLEYSLTQNWALAFDLQGLYKEKTTFTGFAGTLSDGSAAPLGLGEGFQFSFAPAIEYNFNESTGIIGGVWFTFAGKNQPRFFNGVIALNYFGPQKHKSKKKYYSQRSIPSLLW